jgi:ribosomal subunit interface protein
MELIVKSRNGKVTERQRDYIEEKLGKLERYGEQISKATVEVDTHMSRGEGEVYRAQVTLVADRGTILRAEERAPTLAQAIDDVQGKLQRQITRFKDKHWRRGKLRRGEPASTEPVVVQPVMTDDETPRLVRTKQFALKPMFADDAVEQMELLGHTFFVFRDAENSRISVVYRRSDGNYGLIVPEE